MIFKYLGTAAAEGWPAMFCTCDSCKKASLLAGRNIRTRSQAIIDNKLLIDFPADTYMHVLLQGLDLTQIKTCLITHKHSDHLYSPDFEMRRIGFAHLQFESILTVYGTEPTGIKVNDIVNTYHLEKEGRVTFKTITPFTPFDEDGYTITPLKADHEYCCDPIFYIINDSKKTVLYAHDTGYFPDETWDYLEKYKPHFNFVSLDCTNIIEKGRNNHMDIETNIEVKERLLKMHCADSNTVFCLNHFSHNGKLVYDELVPFAEKYGFLVSYDGMSIEI